MMTRFASMFGLILVACSDSPATRCEQPSDCSDGYLCVETFCRRPCNSAAECKVDQGCRDGVCWDAVCGDGFREGPEECDQGEANADDAGCTNSCRLARCGDGLLYPAREQCDDGNAISEGEGECVADCTAVQTCGNGAPEGTEPCDDGAANSDTWSFAQHCNSDCTGFGPYCGDRAVDDPNETCDDGNQVLTDRCPDGPGGTCSWTTADPAHCSIVGTGPIVADGIDASTITITLADEHDNGIDGVIPQFTATGANNTILPSCSSTDTNGISSCPDALKSTTAEEKLLAITSPLSVTGVFVVFVPACPPAYISVPAKPSVGQTTSFCAAKYEAKNRSGSPASEAAGVPWVSLSQGSAEAACEGLGEGFGLINNAEWMAIARNIESVPENWSTGVAGSGSLNRGHADEDPNQSLVASTDDDPCSGTNQTCSTSTWDLEKRTHVLSNGQVIWDFGGNVWEWVSWNVPVDDKAGSGDWQEINVAVATTSMPASSFKSEDTSLTSAEGIGKYCPGDATTGGAAIRSGSWNEHDKAGVFALGLYWSSGLTSSDVGFRCVYRP